MRIKKKPSLSKYGNQKPMNITTSDKLWQPQQREVLSKLPPIRRNTKNVSTKLLPTLKQKTFQKQRKQTQTTLNDSVMLQSFYRTNETNWIKPSDYVKDISQLKLLEVEKQSIGNLKQYDINLTQKFEANRQKLDKLVQLTQKWIQILKKAISYSNSKQTCTDRLIQEIKYWKLLSKKFDELEYQFNDQKTTELLNFMKKYFKTEPQYKFLLEEFVELKTKVIELTPSVKRLHMSLQQNVSGVVRKFQQSSDIRESIDLLKQILIGFESVSEENSMLKIRQSVIYEKIDVCMTKKLVATNLYPRQLANISGLKEKYQIIDQILSFYSHFLTFLEGYEDLYSEITNRVQYVRKVIVDLLQILGYFQFLYNAKQVLQFSKLFSHPFNYNIYDQDNAQQWNQYMDLVQKSMVKHKFEP